MDDHFLALLLISQRPRNVSLSWCNQQRLAATRYASQPPFLYNGRYRSVFSASLLELAIRNTTRLYETLSRLNTLMKNITIDGGTAEHSLLQLFQARVQ